MFFKTCGKYTTYFLIAKKTFFFRSFPLYLHYRISEGLAKESRRAGAAEYVTKESRRAGAAEYVTKFQQSING